MRLSAAGVAAFTTIAIGSPILKSALTVVTEEIYVYPDGEIASTAYITSTVAAQATPTSSLPASTPSTPVPSSSSGSFLQNGAGSSSPSSSLTNITMGTAKYIEIHSRSAVKTTTGFVSPTNPLFSEMALFHTNAHRANSSLAPLTWDQGLADEAQKWADLCIMDEEVGRPQGTGVNAAWSSSSVFNPSDFISDGWYNGEFNKYPWGEGDAVSDSGPAFEGYGHLSQLLWDSTTSFGCGIKNNCGDSWKSHALCYYAPPGNFGGEFSKVGTPNGGPTLRSNSD